MRKVVADQNILKNQNSELKTQNNELKTQNDILFNNLEAFTNQIAILSNQNEVLVKQNGITVKQNASLNVRLQSIESSIRRLIPPAETVGTQTELKTVDKETQILPETKARETQVIVPSSNKETNTEHIKMKNTEFNTDPDVSMKPTSKKELHEESVQTVSILGHRPICVECDE